MALAYEDSRMSMDSDLSNLSPCKPVTSDNKTTTPTTNNISSSLSTKERCLLDEETEALSTSVSIAKDFNPEWKPEGESRRPPKVSCSQSWVDIVEAEANVDLNSQDKIGELKQCKSGSELAGSDSKMSMDESSNSNVSLRSSGSGRQIEIDILDSANVEKYEKLIRDEKIKSPFKRRLSGGGEDDETGDGHAKFDDVETSGDGTPQHKKTKTDENCHGQERFRRESSSSSGDGSSQSSRKPIEFEKDSAILERRQKQIDYGKNTLGYENYLEQVPRDQRTKDHPKTPPKHIKYSRRAWDGVVKVWRKQLHCFDPDGKSEADD
ncbi:histone RNA hairpin-binding protein [Ochlerotatus camptorhynchus]|uniref:histone RNA hairpin-binding protein n=1 Tax=Ochlerotatus camptorhynchus TaxID=644619 RepID=UPI0031DF1494